MDRNGPCKSRGSIIWWIRKEKPSGCGVDGSTMDPAVCLGGREEREDRGGGDEFGGRT